MRRAAHIDAFPCLPRPEMRTAERRPPPPKNRYRSGVAVKIKWFDPAKGFGFVTPIDGSPEAFLPGAAVRAAGYETLPAGTTLVCDLTQGPKGPPVATAGSDDLSTAAAPRRGRAPAAVPVARTAEPQARSTNEFGREVAGTVKFYDARKGFGFVTPDKGSTDIYVGADALKRSGLEFLQPSVRVRVFTKRGARGVEAEKVAFL